MGVPRTGKDGQIIQQPKRQDQEIVPRTANLPVMDIDAGFELQKVKSNALAIQEIQGAILVAKHFPRDEATVWDKVMKACRRPTMAENATYSFPRGGGMVSGPSVKLARMIAGYYGNIRYGLDVIRDDENSRQIQGWCWDIENNLKVSYDDDFKKLIYRKPKGDFKGGWVVPDERDLRELTFRRGAILVRNAILGVIPGDLADDALRVSHETIAQGLKDPEEAKKRTILRFQNYQITVPMINKYLGHKVWTVDDILQLQGILSALKEGVAKVEEYFDLSMKEPEAVAEEVVDKKTGEITGAEKPPKKPVDKRSTVAPKLELDKQQRLDNLAMQIANIDGRVTTEILKAIRDIAGTDDLDAQIEEAKRWLAEATEGQQQLV